LLPKQKLGHRANKSRCGSTKSLFTTYVKPLAIMLMSHGHGSPRKGMSPTANTKDTRDRMIVSGTSTWLIPEDV